MFAEGRRRVFTSFKKNNSKVDVSLGPSARRETLARSRGGGIALLLFT